MQVKIFESTDMASGLKLVKETLGPDALILSTRTIRSGKLGVIGKPVLEITAAIDSPWPESAQQPYLRTTRPASPRKRPFTRWAEDTTQHLAAVQPGQAITYDSQFRLHQEPQPFVENEPACPTELDELKDMVKKLGVEVSRLNSKQESNEKKWKIEGEPAVQCSSPSNQDDQSTQKEEENQLLDLLLGQGISADTAREVLRFIPPGETGQSAEQQECSMNAMLAQAIEGMIHVASPLCQEESTQQRIALVGPTGVGKTTTLAKIAAHYLSNFSSSIALITIDTYRIAAVEQLKVYGAIMNLPVEVVISPEQLEQALLRHADKELILIDTAGRSPKDSLCIKELATFLRTDLAIDKHLVLSATTRESELFETIKRFSILGIDNTIITKTDECATLGVMLDIQQQDRSSTIPFSWITNGQRVPEDLLTASPEIVAKLILTSPSQGFSSPSQELN
ncbi:MAG: flagellar biosynthesis protein FlhF [Desulfobulbaceae bacterium]|nr:flagellar biosynthesis protein FlhF [Desulfobulbaceae bacterium]